MPKVFRDYDSEGEDRRGDRGYRNRSRGRKQPWDDAEALPSFHIPSPSVKTAATPHPLPSSPAPAPAEADAETGIVRCFDAAKGFGFVAPARGPDLFVHITTLRRAGLETLALGQTVRFVRGPGRQPGKEAVVRVLGD